MSVEIKKVPNSQEAEQAVIASILIDSEKLQQILEVIQPYYFYNHINQEIYTGFLEMIAQKKIIDVLSAHDFFKTKNILEKIGGGEYLVKLADSIPTSENALEYAKIIYEKYLIRETLKRASNIIDEAYLTSDVNELVEYAETEIFDLSKLTRSDDFVNWQNLLSVTYNQVLERIAKKGTRITGLHTGFTNLDNKLSGFQKSDLIILAARPSVGKTAFALNLAGNVAKSKENNNARVAFFSLEMSAEQLLTRLSASESRVEIQKIKTGFLNKEEQTMFNQGIDNLSKLNFFIDDTAGIKIGDLKSKSRKLKIEQGLDMIVIDYLQLITTARKIDNRQQEVSEISRELKGLAKELNIPIIALSQLSRGVEQRTNKKPMMSDIRESGAIEQDADIIMMMYRPEYYSDDEGSQDDEIYDGKTEVNIVKHRNGSTGEIEFKFHKEINRFVSVDNIDY